MFLNTTTFNTSGNITISIVYYHCDNNVNCNVINAQSTEQVLTLLLLLFGLVICCFSSHLLKLFWHSTTQIHFQQILTVRRPIHLILSYVAISCSLLVKAVCLMCLYCISVTPPRNTPQGINIWTHSDGTPIYFNHTLDYVLHFIFWILFLLFIHLKLHGLITQIFESNNSYYLPHGPKRRRICNRFGYAWITASVILIISIQIGIRVLNDTATKLPSYYEQGLLIFLAICAFAFINWFFWKYFDAQNDDILLKQQWNKIWLLFISGLIGWVLLFVIWLIYLGEFLMFQLNRARSVKKHHNNGKDHVAHDMLVNSIDTGDSNVQLGEDKLSLII
eukprot:707734_1